MGRKRGACLTWGRVMLTLAQAERLLVDRQLALFLPATHCPGSDQVQRTAQGGKALQRTAGEPEAAVVQGKGVDWPRKVQRGTGGNRGEQGGRSATVILHLTAFSSCPVPILTMLFVHNCGC